MVLIEIVFFNKEKIRYISHFALNIDSYRYIHRYSDQKERYGTSWKGDNIYKVNIFIDTIFN